ncbi:proteinase-activated receptor 1-like isoform X2 [Ctenopharyngodon idella]|uniref:proteinase-activated receptor 1-like isoform X2 n=1 Tax=Ctenopharyngodon idella TaxID=7959 RepID=UPI0022321CA5|nr:proteinase-activated receptor 1-like isoform X2 [Ctenopharyngodon idella]
MEIQAILFLILNAHTCTAIFNVSSEHSLADTAATVEPINPPDQEKHQPVGPRGFAINRGYITQTDEPIDFNMDETLPDSSSTPNKNREGIVFFSYANGRPNYKSAHPCNSTDLNEANCNRTFLEIFSISNEAVLFLKGLLVTRVMPSFYIFIILFSLPLNALALVTFTCKIRMKKPAVIYMSHLACVDLLFTLLLPLKIHYQLNASDWVFGEVACRVISAAYYCYMYCSILLMMCISVDRLLAVVYPIASLPWRNPRKATCVCVLVWLLALAGTVPLLSMRQTFKIKDVGVTCHDALIHDHEDRTNQLYVYLFSILSCLYYFLPLIVTLVSYFTIIYVLSGKSKLLAKSLSLSEKRKRAVIMVIAVLMEFVLCFAPTNGILLYHCVHLGIREKGDSSYAVYLVAACLGSTSVFLDPFLYYYGSSQCRQKIRSVFWWRRAKTNLSKTSTQTGSSFVSCEYSQASVSVKM